MRDGLSQLDGSAVTNPDAEVTRLLALDSCAVSDALDSLDIAGVPLGLVPLTVRRRIGGRAVTVQLAPVGDAPPASRHLGTSAVVSAGPNDVIVVDNGGRCDVAGWGGLLSLAASIRGIAGVVVDGAVRDIDEAHDVEFPIYARVGVPRTARGRIVERATDIDIEIAGVCVRPGDLILADGSGVVVIPATRADAVLSRAEEFVRVEAAMASDLRAARPVTEVMGTAYETIVEKKKERPGEWAS
jgi:regulator of RNase E activity RraA